MFRHPRVFTLIIMILAAIAVVAVLLGQQGAGPSAVPMQQVTVAPPPVLHNAETLYEEPRPAPPPPQVNPSPKHKPSPRLSGQPALVAIIIDDVGLSRTQTLPVINLPAPFTLSFLPYGEHVAELADKAHAAGHTIMLHMPMQPKGHEDPGPNALVPGLDTETVNERITAALARVPHVVGVNNHMGSAATAETALMQAVMGTLKGKGLFFIDSYTSAASVALQAAQNAGIATARRDVFLDDDPSRAAISQQLQRLEHVAAIQGQAIAIGHPYPATMAALHDWINADGGLDSRGIKLVSITELLERAK